MLSRKNGAKASRTLLLLPGSPAVAAEVADSLAETGQVEESVPKTFGSGLSLRPQRVIEGEETFADYLWGLPVIIDDPERDLVQEFRLIGRYQVQSAVVSASQGSFEGTETRRARLGFPMGFLEGFTFQATYKRDGEDTSFGTANLENAWLAWRRGAISGTGMRTGRVTGFRIGTGWRREFRAGQGSGRWLRISSSRAERTRWESFTG